MKISQKLALQTRRHSQNICIFMYIYIYIYMNVHIYVSKHILCTELTFEQFHTHIYPITLLCPRVRCWACHQHRIRQDVKSTM